MVDLTTGHDPKVADWLLEPEGREKNLHSMVRGTWSYNCRSYMHVYFGDCLMRNQNTRNGLLPLPMLKLLGHPTFTPFLPSRTQFFDCINIDFRYRLTVEQMILDYCTCKIWILTLSTKSRWIMKSTIFWNLTLTTSTFVDRQSPGHVQCETFTLRRSQIKFLSFSRMFYYCQFSVYTLLLWMNEWINA